MNLFWKKKEVWTRWYACKTEGDNTVLIRVRDDGHFEANPSYWFKYVKANDIEKIYQENFGKDLKGEE